LIKEGVRIHKIERTSNVGEVMRKAEKGIRFRRYNDGDGKTEKKGAASGTDETEKTRAPGFGSEKITKGRINLDTSSKRGSKRYGKKRNGVGEKLER